MFEFVGINSIVNIYQLNGGDYQVSQGVNNNKNCSAINMGLELLVEYVGSGWES